MCVVLCLDTSLDPQHLPESVLVAMADLKLLPCLPVRFACLKKRERKKEGEREGERERGRETFPDDCIEEENGKIQSPTLGSLI